MMGIKASVCMHKICADLAGLTNILANDIHAKSPSNCQGQVFLPELCIICIIHMDAHGALNVI